MKAVNGEITHNNIDYVYVAQLLGKKDDDIVIRSRIENTLIHTLQIFLDVPLCEQSWNDEVYRKIGYDLVDFDNVDPEVLALVCNALSEHKYLNYAKSKQRIDLK